MDRGIDFLKSQINNAVMQHQTFVENLVDHEKQAEDERFRALCARFVPKAQSHQRMLEEYQAEIGAEAGAGKKMLGKALGMARDLADSARESDFLRLVGDIVTARQSEDTFKTFRRAEHGGGNSLGVTRSATVEPRLVQPRADVRRNGVEVRRKRHATTVARCPDVRASLRHFLRRHVPAARDQPAGNEIDGRPFGPRGRLESE